MKKGDDIIRERLKDIETGNEHVRFDKDASWERLNDRLNPGRKPVWMKPAYRWAAVLLICAAVLPALMLRKGSDKETREPLTNTSPREVSVREGRLEALTVQGPRLLTVQRGSPVMPAAIEPPIIVLNLPEDINADTQVVNAAQQKEPYRIIHIHELNRQEYIDRVYKKGHYARMKRLLYQTEIQQGPAAEHSPYIPDAEFFKQQP